MKKILFFTLILLIAFPSGSMGQGRNDRPWEFFGGIAATNYFGDIGGTSHDKWLSLEGCRVENTRPAIQLGLRYWDLINWDRFAVSGTLSMGWLRGNDKGGPNAGRDYHFSTLFVEPSARLEFFPVKNYQLLSRVSRRGSLRNGGLFSFYVFGGAGAVAYHVMPNENLEDWRESYDIDHGFITGVIPVGLGLKLGISDTMDLGLETGRRFALNDYLDGYTSDASKYNDVYYLTTIQLVYRFQRFGR